MFIEGQEAPIGQSTAIAFTIGRMGKIDGLEESMTDFSTSSMLMAEAEDLYNAMQKANPTLYAPIHGGVHQLTTGSMGHVTNLTPPGGGSECSNPSRAYGKQRRSMTAGTVRVTAGMVRVTNPVAHPGVRATLRHDPPLEGNAKTVENHNELWGTVVPMHFGCLEKMLGGADKFTATGEGWFCSPLRR
jgi:hypothetical protein